jgi:hypothetical protein
MIDPMCAASIKALSAIDKELGLPEDGCNSTQNTLVAIRLLKAAHADDVTEIDRLGKLLTRAVGLINYCVLAGYITNPAIGEEAAIFLAQASTSPASESKPRRIN